MISSATGQSSEDFLVGMTCKSVQTGGDRKSEAHCLPISLKTEGQPTIISCRSTGVVIPPD